jgi:hypothetical protein
VCDGWLHLFQQYMQRQALRSLHLFQQHVRQQALAKVSQQTGSLRLLGEGGKGRGECSMGGMRGSRVESIN